MAPRWLLAIRHDVSASNEVWDEKKDDPLTKTFLAEWKKNFRSKKAIALAKKLWKKYLIPFGEPNVPLAKSAGVRSVITGMALRREMELPDFIIVSPYQRTIQTLEFLKRGWPELEDVPAITDERIRERWAGLMHCYNDWQIFQTLHPEQKELLDRTGTYFYRAPQGENFPDVRERIRDFLRNLSAIEFNDKKILIVSHFMAILCLVAEIGTRENGKLDDKKFMELFKTPSGNCGVTLFTNHGGKLWLEYHGKKFF